MPDPGAWAYPVVLLAMYGVARIGRRERWGRFEWMRLAALALLFGAVVSTQVAWAMLGLAAQPVPLAGALVSLAGAATLIGMYLWERWQERPRLRRITPLWVPPDDPVL